MLSAAITAQYKLHLQQTARLTIRQTRDVDTTCSNVGTDEKFDFPSLHINNISKVIVCWSLHHLLLTCISYFQPRIIVQISAFIAINLVICCFLASQKSSASGPASALEEWEIMVWWVEYSHFILQLYCNCLLQLLTCYLLLSQMEHKRAGQILPAKR